MYIEHSYADRLFSSGVFNDTEKKVTNCKDHEYIIYIHNWYYSQSVNMNPLIIV